jgi:hypothetical protein
MNEAAKKSGLRPNWSAERCYGNVWPINLFFYGKPDKHYITPNFCKNQTKIGMHSFDGRAGQSNRRRRSAGLHQTASSSGFGHRRRIRIGVDRSSVRRVDPTG